MNIKIDLMPFLQVRKRLIVTKTALEMVVYFLFLPHLTQWIIHIISRLFSDEFLTLNGNIPHTFVWIAFCEWHTQIRAYLSYIK